MPGISVGLALLVSLLTIPSGLLAQQRLAVLTEPGTPVIASEFLLTTGPLDEPESLAGLTYLAARSVVSSVQATLDSLGAVVTLTPQKDATSFALIAAPDAWEEASATLLNAIFRDPPQPAAVDRERSAIVEELRGRTANPADVARREADQAFFGLGHPWGRSTVGTPSSVGRLLFDEVESFLRSHFTPDRVFASVVGPVDERDVTRHLLPLLGRTFPAPIEVDPFRPSEQAVREPYNSITTWITASFPFPETADEEAIRFATYLATDRLSFSPQQRSIYDVSSEVIPRAGTGEVRLQVVVPPEEEEAWSERIRDSIAELATEPIIPDVFEGHLRRYRGERLMALSAPEARAHVAARQLLVDGRFTGLVPDLSEMTQERVRAAARSLGSPTVMLLGPQLDQ